MSKTKGSLYEVLKSASRAPGDPPPPVAAPAAPPADAEAGLSLQDRLAAYKARKLAEANTPGQPPAAGPAAPEPAPVAAPAPTAVVARPEPAPPAPVVAVAPPPPPRPTVVELAPLPVAPSEEAPSSPAAGPGERVLTLTYNTAAFVCLVGVGLVFIAYALGLQTGKNRAAQAAPARPSASAPVQAPVAAPPVPPAPAKDYAVRLAEWKYATARDRLTADAAIADLTRALARQNVRNVEKLVIQRGGEIRAALYVDRWRDTASPEARARLAALQRIRIGTQTPFAQAAFEEIPK